MQKSTFWATNNNGRFQRVTNASIYDENDDGKMDIIAYDYNQDGEWDKFEEIT